MILDSTLNIQVRRSDYRYREILKMRKRLLSLIGVILQYSCNSTSIVTPLLEELIITNTSDRAVTNVFLLSADGTTVSCSYIPAGGLCSLGFPATENEQDRAILSWEVADQKYSKSLPRVSPSLAADSSPESATLRITKGNDLELTVN